MTRSDPLFPPLFTGHSLNPPSDPLEQACLRAQAGELGAADVLWSCSHKVADLAIILEPDVPLGPCQQLAPLAMVAMAETLAVLCPPKVSVQFRWPGDVLVNGAKAGDVRLVASDGASSEVPPWLAVGMRLQLHHGDQDGEPGERLDVTSLAEEGVGLVADASGLVAGDENGGTISRNDVIQSLATHFLARLNGWQEEGFAPLADQWLFRAEGYGETAAIKLPAGPDAPAGAEIIGKILGLDEEAGLLVKVTAADGEAEASDKARLLPLGPQALPFGPQVLPFGPQVLPFGPHVLRLSDFPSANLDGKVGGGRKGGSA